MPEEEEEEAPWLLVPVRSMSVRWLFLPAYRKKGGMTWTQAPELAPETLAMGEGRGWALVVVTTGSSQMGGRRGARGPSIVLCGGRIQRTSLVA